MVATFLDFLQSVCYEKMMQLAFPFIVCTTYHNLIAFELLVQWHYPLDILQSQDIDLPNTSGHPLVEPTITSQDDTLPQSLMEYILEKCTMKI